MKIVIEGSRKELTEFTKSFMDGKKHHNKPRSLNKEMYKLSCPTLGSFDRFAEGVTDTWLELAHRDTNVSSTAIEEDADVNPSIDRGIITFDIKPKDSVIRKWKSSVVITIASTGNIANDVYVGLTLYPTLKGEIYASITYVGEASSKTIVMTRLKHAIREAWGYQYHEDVNRDTFRKFSERLRVIFNESTDTKDPFVIRDISDNDITGVGLSYNGR